MKRKRKGVEPFIEQFARSYLNYTGDAEQVLHFLVRRYPPWKKENGKYINKKFWEQFRRTARKMYKRYWLPYLKWLFPKQIKKQMDYGYTFRRKINLAVSVSRLPAKTRSPKHKKN